MIRYRRPLAALALFVVLAVVETWPLAVNPAHRSRNDNADTQLNEWILAWIAHQAPRHPLRLYQANIFYPEPNALAFSESLVPEGLAGAPLFWLGASPVLVYNLLLLAGMALTGWAMCLLVAAWTDDWIAGLAAGILMAFNAHVLTRLPHLQAQHLEFLPLALFAVDRLLRRPGLRPAVWLAVAFALQGLASSYFFVFAAVILFVSVLVRPEDWLGVRAGWLFLWATCAAGLAAAILTPFLLPYIHAARDQGLVRSIGEVRHFSASWRDYLTTPARFHYWAWSHRWFASTALFPGVIGLLLTGVTLTTGIAWRDRRARMCLAFGLCGVLLSFGPALPGYAWLFHHLPPLQAIRAVARFGYLALIAVAVLGGFGLAALRQRLPAGRLRLTVSLAALTLLVLEPLSIPIQYTWFDGIPPVYRALDAMPDDGAVAAFPFFAPSATFFNSSYMLGSTANWRPLLNGYSGFVPASYTRHFKAFRGFPDDEALAALRAAGVRYVLVEFDRLPETARGTIARTPALSPIASSGSLTLYRLRD